MDTHQDQGVGSEQERGLAKVATDARTVTQRQLVHVLDNKRGLKFQNSLRTIKRRSVPTPCEQAHFWGGYAGKAENIAAAPGWFWLTNTVLPLREKLDFWGVCRSLSKPQ